MRHLHERVLLLFECALCAGCVFTKTCFVFLSVKLMMLFFSVPT